MSRRKIIVIAAVVVLVGAIGAATFLLWPRPQNTQEEAAATSQTEASSDIRLIATGDFIAHDSVNQNAKQADGTYQYLPLMSDFQPLFKKFDIRFCNMPILHGGEQFGITGYPVFNAPTEFVTDSAKLGCNLVNTASSHTFDKNQDAINASVAAWDQVPDMLAVAGQNRNQVEHDKVHFFTIKGVKFAFLAYTTYLNNTTSTKTPYGVNMFSKELATKQIAEAKQQGANVVIVSMRWGTEYSQQVTEEQRSDAQFLANQGVALILGHGPHVVQPVETLTSANSNKTVVWYSLGNFLNTQIETEALFNGLAVVTIDPKTYAMTLEYAPIYMHYEWSAKDKAAENLLARKNLQLMPLENATPELLAANQLNTTVEAQRKRLYDVLNSYVSVPFVTLQQLMSQ